jgi:glycosyltransferase involved in cell wall biosynthesis
MKILIFATHPIQYQVPIYRELSKKYELKVIYLLEQTKKGHADAGFGVEFEWDIPLLDGYKHEYLKNHSKEPSSSSYNGIVLNLKELDKLMINENPAAVLINGWFPKGLKQIINYCHKNKIKTICRGDSTLLMPGNPIKKAIKEIYIRTILRKVNAFLYVGNENKKYYKHYGVTEKQLYPGLHCINTPFFKDNFNKATAKPFNKEKIKVGFAGKFIDIKDPNLLLRAVSKSKYKESIELQFIGDGPLKESIINETARLSLTINFLGFLNQTEIVEKGYVLLDFLVLPSKSETWGLVVNEVMTGAIPCIVSDKVGCHSDLIVNNETGFVFKTGDDSDLSSKIDLLIEKFILNDNVKTKVLKHINKYSLTETVKGYQSAINGISIK